MAAPAYEGRIGGKIRRRQPRAAAATPYDRPPVATRDTRVVPDGAGAGAGSGWLSKLVDPASRLIAGGASRIFSSVFRKRLPPPTNHPEGKLESRELPEVTCINPSTEILDAGTVSTKSPLDKGVFEHTDPTKCPDDKGISELERLLKQKTFTKAEFDQLKELLLSRTVEPNLSKPAINNEKNCEIDVPAREKGVGTSRTDENLPNAAGHVTIPEDEIASPAELAKAYMSSRSSNVFHSALRLQSRVHLKDKGMPSSAVHATKPSGLLFASSSTVQFSRLPESGYVTPRPRGRSAIYKMAQSPHFKGIGSSEEVSPFSLTSYHTPTANMYSGRRESRPSHHGNLLISTSTSDEDVIQCSASLPKPFGLDNLNYSTMKGKNKEYEDEVYNDSVTPIAPQSTKMAMKILNQLDKLMPSPKDKQSETECITRDKSPFKVGQASNWEVTTNSSPVTRNALSQKQVIEEDLAKPSTSGVKLPYGSNSIKEIVKSVSTTTSGKSAFDVFSDSVPVPLREKQGFRMIAPEDFVELDKAENRERDGDRPLISSLESGPSSSFNVSSNTDKMAAIPPFSNNSTGFTFSFGPANSTPPPQLGTVPLPDTSPTKKEQTRAHAPTFTFGCKESHTPMLSTATALVKDIVSGAEPTNDPSKSSNTAVSSGISTIDHSKSSENAISSGVLTSNNPPVFAFGASATPNLSNGSLHSSSNLTVSLFPVGSPNPEPPKLVFSASTMTSTTPTSLSASLAAPLFSANPSFHFGSSTSMASQTATSPLAFAVDAGSTLGASAPSNSGSTVLSSLENGSSSTAPSIISSAPAVSTLFTSTSSSQSAIAPSFTFSSTENSIFGYSAPAQSTGSSSFANNSSQTAFALMTQPAQSGSGVLQLPQISASQFSAPLGSASTASGLLNSGFSFSSSLAPASSSSGTNSSSAPNMSTNLFSSISMPSAPAIFNTNSSSIAPSATGFTFTPSTASSSSPFSSNSSLPTVFPFTSASSTIPLLPSSSGSPASDQMNVEDRMADDSPKQDAVSVFGQPGVSPAPLAFDTPTTSSVGLPVFQFSSQQSSVAQNPLPFQDAGGLGVSPGGSSFSLGTGGGDKSGRRIIKVRRDKLRKR
ncbi:nuclear pore complex protein NUP1-like isoform X3 [Ananas comosus]|uniref:Nuclear pore complex protein NUP1-like isoform X3 n=1 Tax=Ananas comosus TaxID=4615 RepID=A0A6P5F775_ANACO|nr:nuclear pore complex protein NUP1-like isoform X3 [Ananas comosus]